MKKLLARGTLGPPFLDKQLFANEQALGLRDPSRPFPVGSAVGVLKWRMVSTDEALVPLLINVWPSQTGANAWEVSVEYELAASAYPQLEVHNLTVTIPTPVDAPPSISTGTRDRRKAGTVSGWCDGGLHTDARAV